MNTVEYGRVRGKLAFHRMHSETIESNPDTRAKENGVAIGNPADPFDMKRNWMTSLQCLLPANLQSARRQHRTGTEQQQHRQTAGLGQLGRGLGDLNDFFQFLEVRGCVGSNLRCGGLMVLGRGPGGGWAQ